MLNRQIKHDGTRNFRYTTVHSRYHVSCHDASGTHFDTDTAASKDEAELIARRWYKDKTVAYVEVYDSMARRRCVDLWRVEKVTRRALNNDKLIGYVWKPLAVKSCQKWAQTWVLPLLIGSTGARSSGKAR
jgi:hypothetical protein